MLSQTQLFWRSSRFLPILSRQHEERNDSPTSLLFWLLHCSRRIVGSGLWLRPDGPWQAHSPAPLSDSSPFDFPVPRTLPLQRSPCRSVERLFRPFPFAAWRACLLSFKEFKGWLPRSALPASFHLLSLFRASGGLLATHAHLGSISCPSSCGQQPGDSPGGVFWSVNATTAEK